MNIMANLALRAYYGGMIQQSAAAGLLDFPQSMSITQQIANPPSACHP